MKKLFGSLIALICVVACVLLLPIEADAETEGYYTYSVVNGEATITDVNTSISGAITIPSTLGGYPVTSIGERAFKDCSGLTGVTIPNCVTSIGNYAFYKCVGLESITIPDSVTRIGNETFYYCTNLKSATIGSGVTTIGSSAFYNCTSLTSVTIGNSVTTIGSGAFIYCTSLTSVTIPDSVTRIDERAFESCTSLTSVTIPDSVTWINERAFYNCTSLTSVTIPDSVTTIGNYAFCGCDSLTHVTIGDNVTTIGENAFLYCTSLTSVTIPDSVTTIGNCAFFSCDSLTHVTIGDSVTTIGNRAFSSCDSLTNVTIGDSVTTIGEDAFSYCTSLTSVTIGDSVTIIGINAFYYCTRLTTVTMSDSVRGINHDAFNYCTCLTSVVYCGTEEQWNAIFIGSSNTSLTNVKRSYHNWQDATCTEPKMCTLCGETTGEAMGHIWQEVTCTEPKICTICGVTEGEILGHNLGIYITKAAEFTHTNASNYPFTNTSGVWYSTNKTHSTSATYTLTATSSGAVTIHYGVSSESNYDKFTVNLNGTTIATISGSTTGSKTMELSAGDKITFTYSKDGSVSNGSDSGWFKIADCEVFDTSVTTQNCTDDVYCDRCNMLIYAAGHNYLDATCTAPKTCTTCGGTDGEALGHSYVAEILEKPTFTTTGQQQKVCSVCGDTITETLDMLVGEVSGWNVTLCDDLRVNFHLTISESIENTARVRIVVGEEGHTFRVSGLEKTKDGLYIASVNIAAAQMTDFIFVTVINGSDLAKTASYTVRGYADTILADEDHSQYHQLVREMLNYGAAAQVYFDYEKDNLASEGIVNTGSIEIPDSVDSELSLTGNAEGVTFYGASLIFRNKITVRYYFQFKGDINDCSFAVNDTTYSPQLKDGLYYVEIADILPQNLDEEITLMVTDAEGNSLKVCYNPMNYIVRMNEKGSAALQNLVKALYNYHLAAKALQETV